MEERVSFEDTSLIVASLSGHQPGQCAVSGILILKNKRCLIVILIILFYIF